MCYSLPNSNFLCLQSSKLQVKFMYAIGFLAETNQTKSFDNKLYKKF